MHRIAAALLALSVSQQEPAPSPSPATQEPLSPPAPQRPAPEPQPVPEPAPAAPVSHPAPAAARPIAPLPPPQATHGAPPPAVPAPSPAPPAPPARSASRPPAPAGPAQERELLLRTALGFMDALLRADAAGLVASSAQRFSFDGTTEEGRDAQARRWREIFAARGSGGGETLRDLVLMDPQEAQEQLGPPPARMAPLLRPGGWVAVADVSGRPLVLFLVPEGDRFAVAGLHD